MKNNDFERRGKSVRPKELLPSNFNARRRRASKTRKNKVQGDTKKTSSRVSLAGKELYEVEPHHRVVIEEQGRQKRIFLVGDILTVLQVCKLETHGRKRERSPGVCAFACRRFCGVGRQRESERERE